jgi:hypothetical protein
VFSYFFCHDGAKSEVRKRSTYWFAMSAVCERGASIARVSARRGASGRAEANKGVATLRAHLVRRKQAEQVTHLVASALDVVGALRLAGAEDRDVGAESNRTAHALPARDS